MKRVIAIEAAVGETRAAVIEDGRPVELHIERWSERGLRAVAGEIYRGRVRKVDGGLNAAFIDLGRGEPGFLPFGKAGRPEGLHEGAAWPVRVTREAFAEKGPTLASEPGESGGAAPALIAEAAGLAERLAARFPDAVVVWADEAGVDLDAAFDSALERIAPMPGGGRLIIEPTAALTAIDIDAGGRTAPGGAEKLAFDLNIAAARESARHVRLRGIGGIVAIDFVHMRAKPNRAGVENVLRQAFRNDPARIDIAPFSPFGIIELARQRTGRAVAEVLLDASGTPTVETAALASLRRLEAEARNQRSRPLVLRISPEIAAWLEADSIGWRAALTDRIGPRFTLEPDEGYDRDRCDARAT